MIDPDGITVRCNPESNLYGTPTTDSTELCWCPNETKALLTGAQRVRLVWTPAKFEVVLIEFVVGVPCRLLSGPRNVIVIDRILFNPGIWRIERRRNYVF